METTPTRPARRSSTVLVGAGAFAGAAAVLLLGAAFTQDPQPARPAGRAKPTPEQVTAETDAAMKVLNQFVGRWDVKGQSFDENDKPVEDFAGSAHYTFVLSENFLRSSNRNVNAPSSSGSSIGFRVASVPEPSCTVLMISAGLLALARRRRRAAL